MSAISKLVQTHRPDLKPYESLYQHFHSNPELSFLEKATATTIHSHLSKFQEFEVFPGIGGHGLAAVFKNGPGKIVLLRADIDGLPVEEKTGLPYASRVRMLDIEGTEKPVMHACGHDMHITGLLAAADTLVRAKKEWEGTLLLVFQPAEEKGAGARAMVNDGLYKKVPVPDVVIGAHVVSYRAGTIGTRRGLMACAADSFNLTIRGRSGHASQPHRCIDPIVFAASTIMRLQTIPSREIDQSDLAVITVGSIHAGDAENIIPEKADLKINVRTIDPQTRSRVLSSIKRIVNAEAVASNAPSDPELTATTTYPFTFNDDDVTAALEGTFQTHFKPGNHGYDLNCPRLSMSEDFSVLATAVDKPAAFFIYGGVDKEVWDQAEKDGRLLEDIPVNHSAFFAPVIQPTLQVAVDGYAAAALTWLAK
ncbi:metal-dependent amidase/aminoacylase/carboxypeptidase [Glonium stellatum]|uniref:Metal-dependent amidase/aminoacylase/carboxypeptidase n=1 Tax=Glonium stellatum TaxID=574774 RepID=A0A8E2JY31_9PEZI|nr:metal-dependent amidase/aminoacylase/carboxypeptidase [Glonium stellatum]